MDARLVRQKTTPTAQGWDACHQQERQRVGQGLPGLTPADVRNASRSAPESERSQVVAVVAQAVLIIEGHQDLCSPQAGGR